MPTNLVGETSNGDPPNPNKTQVGETLADVFSRANGGLLTKPWKGTEMSLLGAERTGSNKIQLPVPPVIVTVDSAVGTPMGELPDRKELGGLHSSNNVVVENGKPRRRSIGEGLG